MTSNSIDSNRMDDEVDRTKEAKQAVNTKTIITHIEYQIADNSFEIAITFNDIPSHHTQRILILFELIP